MGGGDYRIYDLACTEEYGDSFQTVPGRGGDQISTTADRRGNSPPDASQAMLP
jgi:hypothetical protein